jgi:hypothetical protein
LLQSFTDSKERARKLKLQTLAPGWNEGMGMGVIEPTNRTRPTTTIREKDKDGEQGEAGSLRDSPKEMGDETMNKMQRDQMQDWFDKWDEGSSKVLTTNEKPLESVDALI